jgi:hypothetical protein
LVVRHRQKEPRTQLTAVRITIFLIIFQVTEIKYVEKSFTLALAWSSHLPRKQETRVRVPPGCPYASLYDFRITSALFFTLKMHRCKCACLSEKNAKKQKCILKKIHVSLCVPINTYALVLNEGTKI